jgi:hypothetical protein
VKARAVVLGVAVVTFAGGCGGTTPGGDRPDPPPTTAAPATAYRPPADPCAAVPAAVARRLKLAKPTRKTYDLFARDEQRPSDPLVSYGQLTCFWSVANPGRGPDGRPNEMTARVAYSVLTPDRPSATGVAASVFRTGKEELEKKDVLREGTAKVECDEGYDVFVHEESVTGAGSEVEVTVRRANAVVTVAFSGADLRLDPTKPRGLQLVTSPVDEKRLRPVVDAVLPGALALLA